MSPLDTVRAQIREACAEAGRAETSVRLIAVSKTKPFAAVAGFAAEGQLDFGENYVQEALPKLAEARAAGLDLRWHFLGNLQSNKAKLVAGEFSLVHTLDSLRLAEKLGQGGHEQDCLVEVNVDAEASKAGIAPGELLPMLEKLAGLKMVRVRGLMCIPAPGQGRRPFAALRELMETANRADAYPEKLDQLSMGMSADFAEAILEGATFVRVGTALFGARK